MIDRAYRWGEYKKQFVKRASTGVVGEPDLWHVASPLYVKNAEVDVLYQYLGGAYPGEHQFDKWQWPKLVFMNGKYRPYAYAGLSVEDVRDEDREQMRLVTQDVEFLSWLRRAVERPHRFGLVCDWDAYRPRDEGVPPPLVPLDMVEEPVQRFRAGLDQFALLREIPLTVGGAPDGLIRPADDVKNDVRAALQHVHLLWACLVAVPRAALAR